ncbi:MAG: glycosyltransferase [Candidatus Paceibacterota bacterium]|jgi:glycosyltransferase involved in cell wall biosynthesis
MAITISIVTPTYKQPQFVAQAIESVLKQEGNFYVEYIVINDGSPDNTKEIIEEYDTLLKEGRWPIKCLGLSYTCISRENKGQTKTINEGFHMAKGEILAWMNSDDYYLPGAFQAVVDAYEKDPSVDLLYGDTLKVYEDGSRPNTIEPRPRPNETFESLRTRGSSLLLNFFTKRIIDKVGLPDESYSYCMDLELWFRILAVGKSVYIPVTLGAFRLWSGSNTMTKQKLFNEERRRIAKIYGGNMISNKKIYRLRDRIPGINVLQRKSPKMYAAMKDFFYSLIDLAKYTPK